MSFYYKINIIIKPNFRTSTDPTTAYLMSACITKGLNLRLNLRFN